GTDLRLAARRLQTDISAFHLFLPFVFHGSRDKTNGSDTKTNEVVGDNVARRARRRRPRWLEVKRRRRRARSRRRRGTLGVCSDASSERRTPARGARRVGGSASSSGFG